MHLKTDLHKMNYHTVQNSAEVLSAFYLLSPWPCLDTPECDRRYPANTDRADPCGWGGNPLHLHRRGRRWKARRRHRRLSGTPSPSGVAASSAGSLSAMRSWRARTPAAPRTRRWDIRPSTHRWPGGGGRWEAKCRGNVEMKSRTTNGTAGRVMFEAGKRDTAKVLDRQNSVVTGIGLTVWTKPQDSVEREIRVRCWWWDGRVGHEESTVTATNGRRNVRQRWERHRKAWMKEECENGMFQCCRRRKGVSGRV